jgi:predicted membrane-bound mannosyltransferase
MSPRVSRSTRSRARPDRATAVPEVGAAPLKRVVLQVLSLFVLALVIRILHFVQMRHSLVYEVLICDAWQYDQWAQRIASGEWLGTKVFYQTPLYPYSLAVIYAVFGHSVWAVRGVQAVLGSLACAFIARAGARFCSERVGWLAGLLLALYPPAIFFDGILQKASLDLLLVTSLLYALAVYQSRRRRLALAAAGGLLGLFILNRENAAVLFPILLAWIVWIHWEQSWRTRCYRVLAFGISVFAVHRKPSRRQRILRIPAPASRGSQTRKRRRPAAGGGGPWPAPVSRSSVRVLAASRMGRYPGRPRGMVGTVGKEGVLYRAEP